VRGEGRVRGKVMVLIVYNIGVSFRRGLRVGFRLIGSGSGSVQGHG